jgi:peptidoglycan L-alanyl-D-glutamate endopeptidase CwlK
MEGENLLKRIDTSVLYPSLVTLLDPLLTACRARGAEYWAISGERTFQQQDQLFSQGRSRPGKIVTRARAGFSAHNYAIAVDFCRDGDVDRSDLQPEWDLEDYMILAEEARKLGLDSGFYWRFTDAPHIQINLYGLTLMDLRATYRKGGKARVFDLLDRQMYLSLS